MHYTTEENLSLIHISEPTRQKLISYAVFSVALGDLDHDGDLDIVSGSLSGEDYEVIAWQNDGAPFSGTWTQQDVGTSAPSFASL